VNELNTIEKTNLDSLLHSPDLVGLCFHVLVAAPCYLLMLPFFFRRGGLAVMSLSVFNMPQDEVKVLVKFPSALVTKAFGSYNK